MKMQKSTIAILSTYKTHRLRLIGVVDAILTLAMLFSLSAPPTIKIAARVFSIRITLSWFTIS